MIQLNQSLLKNDSPSFATINANLNATTATATIVNATVVNATNMTASGVITAATVNATSINATGDIKTGGNMVASTFTGVVFGTATAAQVFTTALNGDVTGGQQQFATVVQKVGGQTAADVAAATVAVAAATTQIFPDTIVKRDANASINAKVFIASARVISSTVTTPSAELLLQQSGDVYGMSSLSVCNRNDNNGIKINSRGPDICSISMTTNDGSLGMGRVIFEKRDADLHYDNTSTQGKTGEMQIATNGGLNAYFGKTSAVLGNLVVSNLFTTGADAGQNGNAGQGGIVSTSFLNLNNTPTSQSCTAGSGANTVGVPAIAYTMLTIRVNGQDLKIACFAP